MLVPLVNVTGVGTSGTGRHCVVIFSESKRVLFGKNYTLGLSRLSEACEAWQACEGGSRTYWSDGLLQGELLSPNTGYAHVDLGR